MPRLLDTSRWERIVIAIIGAIVAYQVFCEPIVGTADNRDYWRVMKQIGVRYPGGVEPPMFKNLTREFEIVPREPVGYLTSQVGLGRIAVAINGVISKVGTFDIRVMGLVNSAAYLAALAVFLAAFRRRAPWLRVTVGVASLLIFTDVRLVAYFNSFYSEAAQLIFLVASVGFALLAADEAPSLRARNAYYAGFLIAVVLFVFAKNQDLVFCLPLAVIAYRLFPSETRTRRASAAVASAIIALFLWGMGSDAYALTKQMNVSVTLDQEILAHSEDPTADLQELGDGDRNHVTFGRITMFYTHHPLRWWATAKRRMRETFTRPPLGNMELPLTGESQAFDGFSTWKNRHYPRSLWLWLAAIVAYGGVLAARWRLGDHEARTYALVQAMWVVGGMLQFVAVVTFEANGTAKHFFIFNVLVDLVLVMAIGELAALAAAWPRRWAHGAWRLSLAVHRR